MQASVLMPLASNEAVAERNLEAALDALLTAAHNRALCTALVWYHVGLLWEFKRERFSVEQWLKGLDLGSRLCDSAHQEARKGLFLPFLAPFNLVAFFFSRLSFISPPLLSLILAVIPTATSAFLHLKTRVAVPDSRNVFLPQTGRVLERSNYFGAHLPAAFRADLAVGIQRLSMREFFCVWDWDRLEAWWHIADRICDQTSSPHITADIALGAFVASWRRYGL